MNAKLDISQLPPSVRPVEEQPHERLTIEIPDQPLEQVVAVTIIGKGYHQFPLARETSRGYFCKTSSKDGIAEEWFAKESANVRSHLL